MERYRWVIVAVAFVALLVALVLLQVLRSEPEPLLLTTATPAPSPVPTATPLSPRVYVSGAVKAPDVYTLEPGSIVKDAVLAAGGSTDDADLDQINLAASITDGQHIYVPHIGEEELPVRLPSMETTPGKVNVNTADSMALQSLPGIGPALAQRIIDHREAHGRFGQAEDLQDVAGIGPATLEKLRDLITTD